MNRIKNKLVALLLSLGVVSFIGGNDVSAHNVQQVPDKPIILTQELGQKIVSERLLGDNANDSALQSDYASSHYSHYSHSSHYSHTSHYSSSY